MKIEVDEEGSIVLREIYNSVLLRTEEGNTLAVCMRDDTFELKTHGKLYRVDMDTGRILWMDFP